MFGAFTGSPSLILSVDDGDEGLGDDDDLPPLAEVEELRMRQRRWRSSDAKVEYIFYGFRF